MSGDLFGFSTAKGLAGDLLGTKQGVQETNSTSAPWAPAQPYMTDIFSRGQNLAQGPAMNQNMTTANGMIQQRAMNGSPLTQQSQDLAGQTLRGDFLDLSKNPGVQSAMDMAKSNINSQFRGDNFGNSAHQEWLGKGLMGAAAPFYESERNRQMGAMGMAPGLAAQDYVDPGMLQSLGQQQQQAPWDQLFNYQKSIAGFGGMGGQSTNQTPYFQNNTANTLGTAAMMGGLLKMSDRRLKENIEHLGNHPKGFGIYKFKYIGLDGEQIGVMADEVEKVIPEAIREVGGFKAVDYARL